MSERDCRNFLLNITGGYISTWEGIPEAFIFNFILAMILLFILAIIRIIYFYRLHGKNSIDESDWNIEDRKAELLHDENLINPLHPNAYLPPCLHEYSHLIDNRYDDDYQVNTGSLYVSDQKLKRIRAKHQKKLDSIGKHRHWFLDYILINDNDVYKHRGKDAYHYLLFQRYIIYFLVILSCVSTIFLMPVNIYGGHGLNGYFEATTINNIPKNSSLLWIHIAATFSIVFLGVLIMKDFSDLIFFPMMKESENRTVLIKNIPKRVRNAILLKRVIEERISGIEVTRITFTYNIVKLQKLQKEISMLKSSLHYCDEYQKEFDQTLMVKPYFSARLCPLCFDEICAVCYYRDQLKKCQESLRSEVMDIIEQPMDAVFIQFRNDFMARKFLDRFNFTEHNRTFDQWIEWFVIKLFRRQPPDPFGMNLWTIKPAPTPEDVEWSDVIMNNQTSHICSILLNCLILIIFLFLTTPIVAMNFLQEIIILLGIDKPIKEITLKDITIGNYKITLAKYLSAMIINGFACVLPNLIILIQLFVPQSSKSDKNGQIMLMVYLYLVLMVVIFPTFGIISGQYLIQMFFEKSLPKDFIRCVFPTTSSQFYIYYVISCIFINNSAQLLRLPELGLYLLNCICYPKTSAEYERARMETSFQFSYGSNYPRFLLVFTIVTTYSIACPILPPLGLLYMFIKHLVDRYSIYYLYNTQVINANIHQNAIIFVLITFMFLLLQMTTFMNTKHNRNDIFTLRFNTSSICLLAILLYAIFLVLVLFHFKNLYRKDLHNRSISRETFSFKQFFH